MRLKPETEQTMIMSIVLVLIIALFFSITLSGTTSGIIFGHICILDILFMIFGLPIIALWPDSRQDWEAIKNKFKRKGK